MRTIKGPGIALAQFVAPEPPFERLETLAAWAAGLGFTGVQLPAFNPAIFDLERAGESQTWCDEVRGRLGEAGVVATELSIARYGHLVAVHPAYDLTVEVFAPEQVRGNPAVRQAWAVEQVKNGIKATRRLGLDRLVGFPGSLAWPYIYPYPPRPPGLIEEAYAELARRWRPLLDLCEEHGVDMCFEPHPGEDIHDGASFERFLDAVGQHPRACLNYDPSHLFVQHIDYLGFLDVYRDRIRAMHVKDAEWNASPRVGVYGGYVSWIDRPGRFRSLGDGDIDFGAIFSKLAEHAFDGWACLEWECCLKHPEAGAREGAAFIREHIIDVQQRAFDAAMQVGADRSRNRRALGLE